MEDVNQYLNPPSINPTEKVCYKCHQKKPCDNFNKCSTGIYGLHNHCRSCQKDIKRAWYIRHQESERIKSAAYGKTDRNKAYVKRRWRELKHVLGPKSNARRRTEAAKVLARAQRARWRAIPHNRIACSLRGRLRAALRGIIQFHHCENLLGCSYEKFKTHLESQFTPGMTWDNYGDWHIDHRRPCASFDLSQESQQLECFNYQNLQPLWAKDNLSKGSSH